jgi:hypothetical protein
VFLSQNEKEPNKGFHEGNKKLQQGVMVCRKPNDIIYGRKNHKFDGDFLYLALCSGGFNYEESEVIND